MFLCLSVNWKVLQRNDTAGGSTPSEKEKPRRCSSGPQCCHQEPTKSQMGPSGPNRSQSSLSASPCVDFHGISSAWFNRLLSCVVKIGFRTFERVRKQMSTWTPIKQRQLDGKKLWVFFIFYYSNESTSPEDPTGRTGIHLALLACCMLSSCLMKCQQQALEWISIRWLSQNGR